jgi:Ca2+-binding RTX toxin-like protein
MSGNIATSYNFSSSTVSGSGDVLAGVLALDSNGSFPTWQSGTNVASSAVSDQAQADILGEVDLIAFTDGASRTGQTYSFAVSLLKGTANADRLNAGVAGAYHIYGYGGNDSLSGNRSGASNTLEGGTGNDTYTIHQSVDAVVESADQGTDLIASYVSYTLSANVESARAMAAGLTLAGNALNNAISATAGGDTLYGYAGNDILAGSTGLDHLYGGDGADRLAGYDGNDVLNGGNGNDVLYGGAGNDTINGGAGNDYFEGGLGADTLTGGAGADTFVYRTGDMAGTLSAKTDVIKDFSAAEGDRIGLTMFDANSLTSALNRFKYIGSQAFHGVAGELRWTSDGDGITIYGDTNGDKVADLSIHLTGLTTITSSSFII